MKKNIGYKITRIILTVSLISLVVLGSVSITNAFLIRNNSLKSANALGDKSAEDSFAALEKQTGKQLLTQSESLADVSNEKLQNIISNIEMIADAATDIYSNPTKYKTGTVEKPLKENFGKYAVQYVYKSDLDPLTFKSDLSYAYNMKNLLMQVSLKNPSITSAYLGFENGLYVLADKTADYMLGDISFDPRTRPWYKTAVEKSKTIFTDVFNDSENRGLAVSCASPFFANGKLHGVVGSAVFLNDIVDLITNVKIGESGYAYVVNSEGQLIISKNIKKDKDGNIIREDMLDSNNKELKQVTQKMIALKSGINKIKLNGKDVYIAYSPIKSTNWSIATVINVSEALKSSYQSQKNITNLKEQSTKTIDKNIYISIILLLAVIILSIIIVIFIGRKFSHKLTAPILNLTEGVGIISKGDLSHHININSGDEIQTLGEAFNKMTKDIIVQMETLENVTKEKERIGAELDVAKKIQSSMLPCIFPAFPNRTEFDIYATMLPAKEVGGDFYDFFLIDETHLGVVIADVSGKGVPAALFMVIAKTLIKNYAQLGLSPSEIFTRANEQLCEGNDAGMFVTAFMGILEIGTGKFTFVNAGHNPPCLKRADGDFEFLKAPAGFVLAGLDGMKYKDQSINLEKDDYLYLYTDGVTEATNAENQLFSDPYLIEVLNKYKDLEPTELLPKVKYEIDLFVKEAPQFDDITMLALKLNK